VPGKNRFSDQASAQNLNDHIEFRLIPIIVVQIIIAYF